jgi:hypothetical protein
MAGAGIIPAQLLEQFLLAATYESQTTLYVGFRGETPTPLAGDLESKGGLGVDVYLS